MAVEQRGFNIGFMKAAADLSAKQFYIVKCTANETVNLTGAAGEAALGILQNKPKSGEVCDISAVGVSKVKIGVGGLAADAEYMAAADGTAIAATTGKVSLGTVLIGGNAGEIGTVTVGFGGGNALP